MGAAYINCTERFTVPSASGMYVMVESSDGTMMAVGHSYFQNPMLGAPVHIPKWPIHVASVCH